ncbi:MAG: FkbM family methyltransferase [Pseudomonadota bacterium]
MRRAVASALKGLARRAGYDIVRRDPRRQAIVDPAPGRIARFGVDGVDYAFFIARPSDLIQAEHARGALYEPEELAIIACHLPPEAVFVDIGANVGNHTVHALKALGAVRAVVFEPTLFAHTVLSVNLALNELEDRVAVHKLCLSDRPGEVRLELPSPDNWGGASIGQRDRGERVRVAAGDSLLDPIPTAFVKIDVEGHEIAVLRGLAGFIAGCRPPLFVEVDDANAAAFAAWCKAERYGIAARHRRYATNENLLVRPLA